MVRCGDGRLDERAKLSRQRTHGTVRGDVRVCYERDAKFASRLDDERERIVRPHGRAEVRDGGGAERLRGTIGDVVLKDDERFKKARVPRQLAPALDVCERRGLLFRNSREVVVERRCCCGERGFRADLDSNGEVIHEVPDDAIRASEVRRTTGKCRSKHDVSRSSMPSKKRGPCTLDDHVRRHLQATRCGVQ